MALDKDILGTSLKTMADQYNGINSDDIDTARLNFWKGVAEQIIDHLKSNGQITVTVATTGTAAAQTGTGQGTIQ